MDNGIAGYNEYNLGGALSVSSSANVVNCTFVNNSAHNGGAISISGEGGVISGCTFIGNMGLNKGGAIHALETSQMSIVGCTLTGNSAVISGGAIAIERVCVNTNIKGSFFSLNTAGVNGGAINFAAGNVLVSIFNSTFTKNKALTGSGGALSFDNTNSAISIGGGLPLALKYLGNLQTQYSAYYFGTVHVPDAIGYYVVFDANWNVMKGYQCYYRIEIFSNISYFFAGGMDWNGNDCVILQKDSSLWPGMNGNAPLFIQDKTFFFEICESIGGYRFHAFPIFEKSIRTIFDGNSAAISGGAIYSGIDDSNIFIMDNTVFTKNIVTGAVGSGGALFLYSNSLVYIYSSFQENRAYDGGAVTVSQLNSPILFSGCIFMENEASNGGGVFLGDGNGAGILQKISTKSVNFLNTKFLSNSALLRGGGMYFSRVNSATVINSTFSGNSAHQDGGSLFVDSQNIVQINGSTFNSNNAGRYGGALSYNYDNKILFNDGTLFNDNNAGSEGGVMYAALGSSVFLFDKVAFLNNSCLAVNSKGGAVSLHGGSMLSLLGDTSFIGNSVGDCGGAIYSSASTIALGKKDILFSDNSAGQGSALRLELMTPSSVTVALSLPITPILFLRNHCSKRGGTVSWIKDPNSDAGAFSTQTIPNFDRFVWKNNTAVFGSLSSTQVITLGLAGANVTIVSRYNSELLPHPSISLLDYYLAQDLSDSSSTVTATMISSSCMNHPGYLSGASTTTSLGGMATFSTLTAFCFPGGNMTIQYSGNYHYHNYW